MASNRLPPDMVLAYKQYKKDTEIIAGWLAEKSGLAGYTTDSTPMPKAAKLKGRARKLARDAAKEKPDENKPKYAYAIKINDFIPMAKTIARFQPKIILDRTLQSIWERTIRVRSQFSECFINNTIKDTSSNEKHSHFVKILTAALDTLRPCFLPATKDKNHTPKHPGPKPSDASQELNNLFQHLELEDIASDEELEYKTDTTQAKKATPVDRPKAHIEFDEDEAESELLFAVWSFLQDVRAVRLYVVSTWQLYATRKIELMQASMVTNLAVDLIRRGEAELEVSLQRPAKYPANRYPTGSLPFLIFLLHLPDDHGCGSDWNPQEPAQIIICGCEICDFLLYMPWKMATTYVEIMQEEPPTRPSKKNNFRVQVPSFHRGFGFVGSDRYHAQNPSQKAQTELKEILPDLSMLCLINRGAFIEDELLHAARHILDNHKVPIWVSFALQLQLDLQRLHTMTPVDAFADLKKTYKLIKDRCEKHGEWSQSLGFEIWPEDSEKHVQVIKDQFYEFIFGHCGKHDYDDLLMRTFAGESREEILSSKKRAPLLERFPVTCGSMKTEMHLEWHLMGLKLVDATGHLQSLCHLYNTARIIKPDTPVWPDMELVIRNQEPERIFTGRRPDNLHDAHKRFWLSQGMSAAALARDARTQTSSRARYEQRKYTKTPLAQNLLERWLGNESRKVDEAAWKLQQLLFDDNYQQGLREKHYMTDAIGDQDWSVYMAKGKLVQTLAKFSQAFTVDMPAFMVDYFSMVRRSFEIFNHVNSFLTDHGLLEKRKGNGHKDRPSEGTAFLLGQVRQITHNLQQIRASPMRKAPQLMKCVRQYQGKHVNGNFDLSGQTIQMAVDHMEKAVEEEGVDALFTRIEADVLQNRFEPIFTAIEHLRATKCHDIELRQIHAFVDERSYGMFFLRHPSLSALYGPGCENEWAEMAITEEALVERNTYRAETLDNQMLAFCVIFQPKVMYGTGEDSYVATREERKLRAMMNVVMAAAVHRVFPPTQPSGQRVIETEDDDDGAGVNSLHGIYGREGRGAI